jgi:hypothetical protein
MANKPSIWQAHGLAGSANPNINFVIALCGEMASLPIGMTPFLFEIERVRGSSMQEIPRAPNDAADEKAEWHLPIRLIRGQATDPNKVVTTGKLSCGSLIWNYISLFSWEPLGSVVGKVLNLETEERRFNTRLCCFFSQTNFE